MFRTDADANVANKYDEGDPLVPRLPTQISADHLNAIQEELCNAITAAGIVLAKGDNTQLSAALVHKAITETITGLKTFTALLAASGGISVFNNTVDITTSVAAQKALTATTDDNVAGDFSTGGPFAAVRGYANDAGGCGIEAANGNTANVALRSKGTIDFSDASTPASTVGHTNKISRKSTIKAWGLLYNDGAGNVSVLDGFNITSTSISGTQYHRVTIADDMANTVYAVTATMMTKLVQNAIASTVNVCNLAVGSFDLAFFDTGTNTQKAINTGFSYYVSFMVLGTQ